MGYVQFKGFDVNKIKDNARKAATKLVEKKVGPSICPIHHKRATVRVVGQSGDRIEHEVTGCCKEHIEAVKKGLGGR